MKGQLGHRDQDAMIKRRDSDFPEPGRIPSTAASEVDDVA